ncbi:hypothetical protein STRDD11_01888 [Streptococcus sp. DD11]|uniref:hypothetical protein n=1 Tax=Streptococcus sp. DD11 TaxID=1777879 RepID=UPI0007943811|nr:hypothetical protein [Streptococcus sp. DD11]KXT82387.1 hypothetical protein STRDD11_01888 [Streptococcus sp. DD11]
MKDIIDFLNQNSDVIQIVLACLSLIASIIVAYLIYWLQTKHEKEVLRLEEKRRTDKIKTEAKQFLIDFSEEKEYLPLCMIANNVNLHKKHHRKIYTSFNRCSIEVQEAILKQAKFPVLKFENDQWVDDYLKQVRDFSERNNLGESLLYDGFKYFHHTIEQCSDKKVSEFDTNIFTLPDNSVNRLFHETNRDLESYIYEYLKRENTFDSEDQQQPLEPPYDVMWSQLNLGGCPEYQMCFWTVKSVLAILSSIAYSSDTSSNFYVKWQTQLETDVKIETFEDFYYQALLKLYMVYTPIPKES